ncbi:hypothetical protein G5B30_05175 [Sphingobacterium sp. SGG-5]|uniref:hypothetical protein n=1 Tax=Sphingobacterium sp. SGG-5 TaxID=2710881 RepID=UPI0013EAB49C|nr:hypothetical protein [Sphingobacterium sp. SGG-5]NGM61307.1 hypothetical protein [Sphingobacterium sp. SGG-5]
MMDTKLIGLLFLLLFGTACSKDPVVQQGDKDKNDFYGWTAGKVIKDAEGWTEVVIGDYPLVLSVPHGGGIKPEHIPDRTCTGSTTVLDTWTIEMARAIQQEFKQKLNKTPFVVISHLSRKKIDQNRTLDKALCTDKTLEPTWYFYHNYLDSLLRYSSEKYGKTLFIDLHAHGHTKQRLELGYNLSTTQLDYLSKGWDLSKIGAASSYANLLQMNPAVDIQGALIGDHAFGTLMQEKGFPSVPSRQDPVPAAGDAYFTGGDNTQLAASDKYPKVYGFQIESNSGSRNTEERRAEFAKRLVESVEVMVVKF